MTVAQTEITDTRDNVYFCDFVQRSRVHTNATNGVGRNDAEMKRWLAEINDASRDTRTADLAATQYAAENTATLLASVGMLQDVAYQADRMAIAATGDIAPDENTPALLAEIRKLMQESARAAADLLSLSHERENLLCMVSRVLQDSRNRIAGIQRRLNARRPKSAPGAMTLDAVERLS